ncbi:unnamed protein product [Rotaria magnacalcarata]|uniref:Uncharacterized protein n=1 Tax=Rotaria magnacalcarata TaxID=392030 RepID=A0A816M896_9BILA|nr:unnamed protein product [Rotaria magnacalcarata]
MSHTTTATTTTISTTTATTTMIPQQQQQAPPPQQQQQAPPPPQQQQAPPPPPQQQQQQQLETRRQRQEITVIWQCLFVLDIHVCVPACPTYQACSDRVCVGSGEFGISVTWSRPGDGDIVVTTPLRKSIYYSNKGPSAATDQGQLDHDDTSNTGPENIFWNVTAPTGVYHICFQQHSFSMPSSVTNPITATFQIRKPRAVTQTLTKTFVNGHRITPHTCNHTMLTYVGSVNYP